jgi:hypothetical protein
MKYLFCLFISIAGLQVSVQAQAVQNRVIAPPTDAMVVESQLNLLHLAIADRATGKIQQAEVEMLSIVRNLILDTKYGDNQRLKMEQVLSTFEGFTFVGADQKATDAHLEQLELLLAIVRE